MMTSHPQLKKLAKNQFELEAALAESSISSAYYCFSPPSSNSSSPNSSSFNSASIFAQRPIILVGGDNIFNDNQESLSSSGRRYFKRLLSIGDHRKLTSPRCVSSFPKASWEKFKHSLGSSSNMANHKDNHDSSSPLVPTESRKQMVTGRRKEELEREVSFLHKMLDNEQKVRQYLEHLDHRKDGSAFTIPNFLPQNMKEMLTELEMVENEITSLENQIKQLNTEVKHEKEVNMETKYKEWGRGKVRSRLESSPMPPHPNRKPNNEKAAFEPKAMHFISKAIKGEYGSDEQFSLNEKSTSSRGFLGLKENAFQEVVGGLFRDKAIKKSGMLKLPSPLRERRKSTPKKERSLEVHTEVPPKSLPPLLHSEEENIQRWPPNKLSENIMKCLLFIFVRLLRTSRVMDIEKSGPTVRSMNFALSFRSEASSNSKTSLISPKDSRQQDPYGIFDSEESIPRDIGPYKNLIRFAANSMDMKCIQNSSSVPLYQRLKLLLDCLQKVDLRFLSHQQKLAFWINMYNACIMHGYLQHGLPSVFSPENLLALINKATLNIAGNTISAQAIEHFILRKPEEKLIKEILEKDEGDSKKMVLNELYGLESPDPYITFALCCGTRSSPAVKIYTADGVTAELEKSKLEYLQAAIMVTGSKRIFIPELLLRNMDDFAADKDSLMEWICQQLPTSCSLRKSIVDCFRGLQGAKASAVVERMPYEFEFQYLLAK